MGSILIVEDEDRIRRVYKEMIERQGHKVFEAPDAVYAREILKKVKMDLILLDINMGDVNGQELYEVIELFHREIKIIVSSVYPIEDQKEMIPHAYDYYDKADGVQVLMKKIHALLGRRHIKI